MEKQLDWGWAERRAGCLGLAEEGQATGADLGHWEVCFWVTL